MQYAENYAKLQFLNSCTQCFSTVWKQSWKLPRKYCC